MSHLSPSSVALWVLIVLLASSGQLSFKAAAADPTSDGLLAGWLRMLRRPWLWVGIGCFLLHFVLWIAFLSSVQLSEGMMLAALQIVVVFVAGRVLFHEPGSWLRLGGVALISLGVAIVALAP
jgi:drug/metabolite transporter (DMT)-like permease